MSQLFELQPENLNGHGIQRPRPHKSPDKTIIISKERERKRERKGRGGVAETGTIFPGNSCQVRKLGYKLHNEPTPNQLLFRDDQSENSEACRDNISLITGGGDFSLEIQPHRPLNSSKRTVARARYDLCHDVWLKGGDTFRK